VALAVLFIAAATIKAHRPGGEREGGYLVASSMVPHPVPAAAMTAR